MLALKKSAAKKTNSWWNFPTALAQMSRSLLSKARRSAAWANEDQKELIITTAIVSEATALKACTNSSLLSGAGVPENESWVWGFKAAYFVVDSVA
eukprot:g15361.t1